MDELEALESSNGLNAPSLGSNNSFRNAWLKATNTWAGNPLDNYAGTNNGGMFDNLSSFEKFNAGLGTFGAALSAFNGWQQNKLAKQQLAFQKDAFNKQYAAQRGLTNSQLQDRETRRYNEAIAQGYTPRNSVAEYMDKYGIK